MRGRITKRSVEAIPAGDRDTLLWDDALRGFGVKVTPAGRRVYVAQSRLAGAKRRWTIGEHGPLTADQARKEAAALLGKAARGIDPAEERKRSRAQGMTVAALCDLYLADAEAGRVRYRGKPKKASTLATDAGRIERHIKPLLGSKRLASVSRNDVERFIADVAAGKTATVVKTGPRGVARVTGGEGTARRTAGLFGAILGYGVTLGLLERNPAAGVERSPDGVRDRHLDATEYARFGAALRQAAAEGKNPHGLRAARLLALTAMRKGEVLSLRPSYIDRTHRCVRLPDGKGGRSVRPLGVAAMAVVDEAMAANEGGEWLFPSDRTDGHFTGIPKIVEAVAERAGLEGVTCHVLRHSFNSTAAAMGVSQSIREALMGQAGSGVNSRNYTHFVDAALVAVADRIAAEIAKHMGEDAGGADVVELAVHRRAERARVDG